MEGHANQRNRTHATGFALLVLFSSFLTVVTTLHESASARTATEIQASIMDKAVLRGVYDCYVGGYLVSELSPLSNYNGISSLMTGNSGENFVPLVTGVNSDTIWATSRYMVKDAGLSCKQLFEGGSYSFGGSNSSILSATGHNAPSRNNSDSVKTFMENMGYTVTTAGSDSCYSLPLTANSNVSISTNKVCQGSNGKLYTEGDGSSAAQLKVSGNNKVCLYLPGMNGNSSQVGSCTTLGSDTFDGEWLLSVVKTACGSMTCNRNEGQGSHSTYTFNAAVSDNDAQDSMTNSSARFINNSAPDAGLTAVKFLSDGAYQTLDSLNVSDVEKRMLYQAYLSSYYGVTVNCGDGLADSAFDGTLNWYVALANSTTELSDAEKTEKGALARQLAKTKGADGAILSAIYGDPNGRITQLSTSGLQAFNADRLQNDDVSALMGKKAAATSRYLNDLASNSVKTTANGTVDWGHYATSALTDSEDIASQSAKELNRFINYLPDQQIEELVTNPQYQAIVSDYSRRQAIEGSNAFQRLSQEVQAEARREVGSQAAAQRQETYRRLEQQAANNPNGVGHTPPIASPGSTSAKTYTIIRPPIDVANGGFAGGGTWSLNEQNQPIYQETGRPDIAWNGESGRIIELSSPIQPK